MGFISETILAAIMFSATILMLYSISELRK